MKNEQTMKNLNLTDLEKSTLQEVCFAMSQDNYSEYQEVYSAQEKGLLGSLIKKGLVYDAYKDMGIGSYMFCLTSKGIDTCKELEISTNHITIY